MDYVVRALDILFATILLQTSPIVVLTYIRRPMQILVVQHHFAQPAKAFESDSSFLYAKILKGV